MKDFRLQDRLMLVMMEYSSSVENQCQCPMSLLDAYVLVSLFIPSLRMHTCIAAHLGLRIESELTLRASLFSFDLFTDIHTFWILLHFHILIF